MFGFYACVNLEHSKSSDSFHVIVSYFVHSIQMWKLYAVSMLHTTTSLQVFQMWKLSSNHKTIVKSYKFTIMFVYDVIIH